MALVLAAPYSAYDQPYLCCKQYDGAQAQVAVWAIQIGNGWILEVVRVEHGQQAEGNGEYGKGVQYPVDNLTLGPAASKLRLLEFG